MTPALVEMFLRTVDRRTGAWTKTCRACGWDCTSPVKGYVDARAREHAQECQRPMTDPGCPS